MKTKKFKIIVSLIAVIALSIFVVLVYHPKVNDSVFIHISFDDTITVFEDLTIHENDYQSAFDNDFLRTLKSLHERYGAVFSLYCFYASGDFDLGQCTDKFAAELNGCSDWLRFGFHNIDGSGNLANANSETALSDYTKTITELIRITGSTESIDTFVRLQNFAGSTAAIDALNNAQYGIDGLLTADDERISYNLSVANSTLIANNDTYYDAERDLWFVSTDLRLENVINPCHALSQIKHDSKQNKIIEVFTHEWLFDNTSKAKLYAVCFWAEKNGYSWDFAMNRL